MPRNLKVYQTSIGFYDLVIATPSMKAALEAWGAASNLFHQGFAKDAQDPAAIDAAMQMPGVVLRRPIGSNKPFSESADLPDDLTANEPRAPRKAKRALKERQRNDGTAANRRAAAAYGAQLRKDEAKRRRAKEQEEKARERRESAIMKAESALNNARQEHEAVARTLTRERDAIYQKIERESHRWADQEEKLQAALKRKRMTL